MRFFLFLTLTLVSLTVIRREHGAPSAISLILEEEAKTKLKRLNAFRNFKHNKSPVFVFGL